jgi:hypothetical protein
MIKKVWATEVSMITKRDGLLRIWMRKKVWATGVSMITKGDDTLRI